MIASLVEAQVATASSKPRKAKNTDWIRGANIMVLHVSHVRYAF